MKADEITDDMLRAGVEAMGPDRIQGFSTPQPIALHVRRQRIRGVPLRILVPSNAVLKEIDEM